MKPYINYFKLPFLIHQINLSYLYALFRMKTSIAVLLFASSLTTVLCLPVPNAPLHANYGRWPPFPPIHTNNGRWPPFPPFQDEEKSTETNEDPAIPEVTKKQYLYYIDGVPSFPPSNEKQPSSYENQRLPFHDQLLGANDRPYPPFPPLNERHHPSGMDNNLSFPPLDETDNSGINNLYDEQR